MRLMLKKLRKIGSYLSKIWLPQIKFVYLQGKIKVMIQATMHSHSVLEEVIYNLQSKGAIVDPCIVDDLITCVKTHAKVEFKNI